MIYKIFKLSLLPVILIAGSIDEFKKEQSQNFQKEKNEFLDYKKNQESDFKSYQEAQLKTYNEYKKELSNYWDNPQLSSKKIWMNYSRDKKTRTNVNFEKETITLQTIAPSKKEADEKLKNALSEIITIDTKKAQESDLLEQKLSKIKKPSSMISAEVESEPILSSIIFDEKPTKENLISYVDKTIKDNKISSLESTKIKNNRVYTLNISLPKDAMLKRSKIYYEEVKTQAKKQNLPISLVFAIMHTESSFNPRARSYVPAYGLMQIVPQSAGIDSYLFLYNEKKLLSSSYLYNSKNNITIGSAYLHILYYKYLSKIKNPLSRLYCTIAAYNTGAGNVAWAFTKTNDVNEAALIINSMKSHEVYEKLLRNLKYNEPKEYLKNVSKRINSYHKAYGS